MAVPGNRRTPGTTPGVRYVVSPVAVAVWIAVVAVIVVAVFYDSPRILTATAAGWTVGLITFATIRRR